MEIEIQLKNNVHSSRNRNLYYLTEHYILNIKGLNTISYIYLTKFES